MSTTATNPVSAAVNKATTGQATHFRVTLIDWAWRAVIAVSQFWTWALTLPWRGLRSIAPDFMQPTLSNIESTVYSWTEPAMTLVKHVSFNIVNFFDRLLNDFWTTGLDVHHANMKHLNVAYEAYTRLIQHKADLIKKEGLIQGTKHAVTERY